MQCTSCNAEVAEGLGFCPHCGAPVTPQASPPPPSEAAPTTQMPPVAQPTAVMPPVAPPPVAPAPVAGAPYGTAISAAPAKKSNALMIILIIVGLLMCCCVAAVGGGWYYLNQLGDDIIEPVSNYEGGATSGEPTYATAEEAVESALPDDTWVYELTGEDGDTLTYMAGPPNSEAVMTLEVVKEAGGWRVRSTQDFDPYGATGGTTGDTTGGTSGGSSNTGGADVESQAQDVVRQFLNHIMDNEPLEAQKLCVEPFSNDPASAQYADGDFLDFKIDATTKNADDTVYVDVVEFWNGYQQESRYYVVPTEAGYRISELSVK